MNVRKHSEIGAHNLSVRGHAHVRFQVAGRGPILFFYAELEARGLIGLQWAGATQPYHPAAVGELGLSRIGNCRRSLCACLRSWLRLCLCFCPRGVIACESCTVDLGKLDAPNQSPGE